MFSSGRPVSRLVPSVEDLVVRGCVRVILEVVVVAKLCMYG